MALGHADPLTGAYLQMLQGGIGSAAQTWQQQQQLAALTRLLQNSGFNPQQAADLGASGAGNSLVQALVQRALPPAPMTPYQQAQLGLQQEGLDLRRQQSERAGQMTPYQQAELGMRRQSLELQRQNAGKAKQEPLVEIFDPSSPTGTMFVPRSEAAGKYGKPPSGLSFETTPEGGVKVTQGRVGAGGVKPPVGYEFIDPDNPRAGIQQMAGKGLSPEQAGKAQLGSTGLKALNEAEKLFFGPDGSLNRSLIGEMNAPIVSRFIGGEPRQARIKMLQAIEAQLRLESGAAVPDSEVERAAERFMPGVTDSPETVRQKLGMLRELLQGAEQRIGQRLPEKPAALDFTREDVEKTAREESMTPNQVIEHVAKSRGLDPAAVKRALGYAP